MKTPTRIEGLEPGNYTVTIAGPNLTGQDFKVNVLPGKQTTGHFDLGPVNYEELEKVVKP